MDASSCCHSCLLAKLSHIVGDHRAATIIATSTHFAIQLQRIAAPILLQIAAEDRLCTERAWLNVACTQVAKAVPSYTLVLSCGSCAIARQFQSGCSPVRRAR